MKTRYNTYDIICTIVELQKFIGMRVNNIYDIDNKTYLIRLQRTEEKQVLLLESGIRIHSTSFEWPKNVAPSGFSMKMRKHLKNKRLESLTQLGMDRIVDLTFGSGEAAYHLIIELFDRGNMLLTDHEYTILYVLRPHTEGDKMKFAVKEKYPLHRARSEGVISREKIIELISGCKQGDQLKKVLVPNLEYGPPMIEHVLRLHGLTGAAKIGKDFNISSNIDDLMAAINDAENLFQKSLLQHNEGYIIQKKEERMATDGNSQSDFFSNQEFHPILFEQHKLMPYKSFTSFNEAVDEFFSSLESQKLELRAVQQEKDAMKKLENVRKDHNQRLQALEKTQNVDKQKAELITRNQELVDSAILAVQTLLANQISWEDIEDMVKTAASKGDPVAKHIKQLKLEMNHISLHLSDPFEAYSVDSDDENNDDKLPPMIIEIDLALSAFANARKYYNQKRTAAKKQQKTIESQSKALKSAERKTKQTLKEVQTITNINKARKVYWFEKFFWFVSSENYLVIAGRDQQQNELIVKRYMKPTDIYVHADIHGASSVIIKNPNGLPVPPKTLNEAGTMAICYSVAWDAKIVTNAYWVWGEQVSKTAPTGEYLSTGSFMIRGKKNFLPPTHLILGLSFLFRLEDGYIEKHKGERRVMNINENDETNIAANEEDANEVEVEINDSDGNEDDKETETGEVAKEKLDGENKLEDISEHSSSDSEDDTQFPDTHIKIQHFAGTKVNLMTENTNPTHDSEQQNSTGIGQNKLDNKKQTKDKNKPKNENRVRPAEEKDSQNAKQQVSKRGQKSKLKKIKEKYKDQDEEERKMRMEILQSSGTQKDNRKSKKGKEETLKRKPEPRIPRAPAPKEPGGDDADDEPTVQADVDVIDALTGVPATEDELLFAVPVVAPYNALSSYKFKVKLTPGTAKRGKAAKTAVAIFLKDRAISTREKDLLKAVKDEQLARNIPGKVKLSAPKLQVNRK